MASATGLSPKLPMLCHIRTAHCEENDCSSPRIVHLGGLVLVLLMGGELLEQQEVSFFEQETAARGMFGVPPSGGKCCLRRLSPPGGTPNTIQANEIRSNTV